MRGERVVGWALRIGGWSLKAAFVGLAVLLPLCGVWIASSLAAFDNASMAMVAFAGALAFPLVPLGWDALGMWRRQRRAARGVETPQVLTFFDRFVLRTLAVNLVFVGGLLAVQPDRVFVALAARGDWMLDHAEGRWADDTRRVLFAAADRLEWLHVALHPSPFDATDGEVDDDEAASIVPVTKPEIADDPPEPARRDTGAVDPWSDAQWPFRPTVHPAVASMPPEVETSIESVGRWLLEHESDPTLRIKAIHDYVATRVAYDAVSFAEGIYPPQDAETVFRTRLSVCAGYANLVEALAGVTGDEVVVVTGHARRPSGEISGLGHAWNAARIGDRWLLLDATWDAGSVDGRTFEREYETTFLMSPPEVFGTTHFPDDPQWQLRPMPISRGEFVRQPYLRGNFHAHGLKLVSPDRSQTTVDDAVTIEIANPLHQPVEAWVRARGEEGPFRVPCGDGDGEHVRLTCELPRAGEYEVGLFVQRDWAGALQVNARG